MTHKLLVYVTKSRSRCDITCTPLKTFDAWRNAIIKPAESNYLILTPYTQVYVIHISNCYTCTTHKVLIAILMTTGAVSVRQNSNSLWYTVTLTARCHVPDSIRYAARDWPICTYRWEMSLYNLNDKLCKLTNLLHQWAGRVGSACNTGNIVSWHIGAAGDTSLQPLNVH